MARFVAAFIRGVQSEGVLATAKHFPGHGDVQIDSHRALPVLQVSRERLEAIELVPFRAAIGAGVSSVMLAHLALPELDPTPAPPRRHRVTYDHRYSAEDSEVMESATLPASLSPKIAGELLRRDLGFGGLVVTDALDMGGITRQFDPGEAAVRALEAGADQIVKSNDTDAAIEGVRAAVRSGRLSVAQIDAAVERVLQAKRQVSFDVASPEEIFRRLDSAEVREAAQEIATRGMTLVREQPGVLPLRRDAEVVSVLVADFPEPVPPLGAFDWELSSRLAARPRGFYLDRRSTAEELRPLLEAARQADVVILTFTIRFKDGSGSISVPEIAKQAVAEIATLGVPMIGISFGTPYALRDLTALGTFLAAYGVQPLMQAAAGRALFGEKPVTGRLPVSIPGLYPLGHGILRHPERSEGSLRDGLP